MWLATCARSDTHDRVEDNIPLEVVREIFYETVSVNVRTEEVVSGSCFGLMYSK